MSIKVSQQSGPHTNFILVSYQLNMVGSCLDINTDDSDGLYTDSERVGSKIARVRKAVFLPQLREQSIHASNSAAAVDVVS
jgi:hypothetical protein